MKKIIFLLLLLFLLIRCNKSNSSAPPVLSSQKNISAAVFKAVDNTSLPGDMAATISTDSVKFQFLQNISLSNLIPTIVITGKTINPPNHTMQNFTSPVTYTVTAEDGTTKNYIFRITQTDSAGMVAAHWRILRDSLWDSPGFSTGSGHPIPGVYYGVAADYYDFNSSGQLSVHENGNNAGTTYQVLSNNKLSVVGLDVYYDPGTIETLTSNTFTISWAKTQTNGERYFRRLYLYK